MDKNHNRSYTMIRKQILNAQHYFQLLEVHRHSTTEEVRAARNYLAWYVHPDVNAAPEAPALMARVNQAHRALTVDRDAYLRTLRGSPCPDCRGVGGVRKQKGFTQVEVTVCKTCFGAGVVSCHL